jgi:hypothetical protein
LKWYIAVRLLQDVTFWEMAERGKVVFGTEVGV